MSLMLFLLLLTVGLVVLVISVYNALVRLRNRYLNAFAQIDVQLKRRHDLIPNLVEAARGYLSHERETLEAVIRARAGAVDAEQRAAAAPGDPAAMRGLMGAEQLLTGALGKLFALSEAYPDLKADRTIRQLTEELTSTENRVAFARQGYNDAAMAYNTRVESFPGNVIGPSFGFQPAGFLEAVTDAAEREAPRVSFGT
jgi:LemA protein